MAVPLFAMLWPFSALVTFVFGAQVGGRSGARRTALGPTFGLFVIVGLALRSEGLRSAFAGTLLR